MDSVIFKNINTDGYYNPDAIDKLISYIYRTDKSPLLIYCYGCIEWPPTYNSLIKDFHSVRETAQMNVSDQQVMHFIISFGIPVQNITNRHFQFADDIAKLFRNEYQICYSYHEDTRHPHFHYAVSTTSYLVGNPILNNDRMAQYESLIYSLANAYGFKLHTEGEEENV